MSLHVRVKPVQKHAASFKTREPMLRLTKSFRQQKTALTITSQITPPPKLPKTYLPRSKLLRSLKTNPKDPSNLSAPYTTPIQHWPRCRSPHRGYQHKNHSLISFSLAFIPAARLPALWSVFVRRKNCSRGSAHGRTDQRLLERRPHRQEQQQVVNHTDR
ncbi:hypothetical protein OE88DRAFT_1364417 [Heliocybe sulcata]|uniref:Uncharacterized protein n=1 Tax=Heliocybe sulcata TaxID=5364 RepID=A0A5C3N335_9AGAM|nr:hypothetical protein OE88DRAFT_1364417 [Heliocybe sulcata]